MKIYTIAESINIMSKTIGPAIREKEKGPIQKMAEEEIAAGADMLDLNLGRLRRELEASRDYLFAAAGIPRDLYRPS